MTGERVSINDGKLPIIVVAPHGFERNDENTSIIVEEIAKIIPCYFVINRGWKRSSVFDFAADKADCNNITHCLQDVVQEEFLLPIIRFKKRILQNHPVVYIYYIHGMGNHHRKIVNEEMDIVVGYGAGKPDSHTCSIWRKNVLCDLLSKQDFNVFEGKKGGSMSGWSRYNLNQYFRKWEPDDSVQSFQLEIIHEIRSNEYMSKLTAELLAPAMKDLISKEYKKYKNFVCPNLKAY